jgi:outer membrane protein TolC
MNLMVLLTFLLISINLYSETNFLKILNLIDDSPKIQAELANISSTIEQSELVGSWGDPKFKISAMNFPKDSLSRDTSMMTGIQFGLSQKFSLTGKYGALKDSMREHANAGKASLEQLKRELAFFIWQVAIEKEKLVKIKKILQENLAWMKNNLKVTNRLYSTGKLNQQAVLDLKIRLTELETEIEKNKNSVEILNFQLTEILNNENILNIDLQTVSWERLNKWNSLKSSQDVKIQSLKHMINSKQRSVSAQNRNYFPDVTIGVSYTKRNDIDGVGDFVGASLTIPIPLSSKRYAKKDKAVFEKYAAEKKLRSYKITKKMQLEKLKIKIKENEKELSDQKNKNVQFAKSSRDIVAKSYARGGSDYIKFLKAELQYQTQLVKKVNLESSLKNKKLKYLFIHGDSLGLENLK